MIVGVRPVGVSAAGTVGAATGAGAGGIVGAQTPGGGVATAFGALGGALVGGIVGTATEHATADTTAYEYIVRKPNGDLVSVTQRDPAPLGVGQKVLVIAGNQARIVPDYTVPVDTAAAHSPPPNPASTSPGTSGAPPVIPVTATPLAQPTAAAVSGTAGPVQLAPPAVAPALTTPSGSQSAPVPRAADAPAKTE